MKFSRHTVMWSRHANVYGTGEPFQYELRGLPAGDQVFINNQADMYNRWQILRIKSGVQGEWSGNYETLDAAQGAVEREYDMSPPNQPRFKANQRVLITNTSGPARPFEGTLGVITTSIRHQNFCDYLVRLDSGR